MSSAEKILNGKPKKVVQLSDPHLFGDEQGRLMGVDTSASFQAVIELAKQSEGSFDCVVITGDIAQEDPEKAYFRLAQICAGIGVKVYCLPGNHDEPESMSRVLSGYSNIFGLEKSFDLDSWQIILLNSARENRVEGHLSDEELTRLEAELSKGASKFSLVCLHHQPIPVSSPFMDAVGLDNQIEFWELLSRHNNVKSVVWGHVHQEFSTQRDGILWLACPSTCVQLKPQATKFTLEDKAPGYRLLELHPDGKVTTKVNRLLSYPLGLDLSAEGY